MVTITFDPMKDQSNYIKHGVSLALASQLDWYDLVAMPDNRKDYLELREIGYGIIGQRLYCVVFTQRTTSFHIISLRKANRREVLHYEQEICLDPANTRGRRSH
ncbi:BrnT family toxin [Alcaligenaceae bacterium]|nr:BrnT family toxin [Alcaligenaceae bacterium]